MAPARHEADAARATSFHPTRRVKPLSLGDFSVRQRTDRRPAAAHPLNHVPGDRRSTPRSCRRVRVPHHNVCRNEAAFQLSVQSPNGIRGALRLVFRIGFRCCKCMSGRATRRTQPSCRCRLSDGDGRDGRSRSSTRSSGRRGEPSPPRFRRTRHAVPESLRRGVQVCNQAAVHLGADRLRCGACRYGHMDSVGDIDRLGAQPSADAGASSTPTLRQGAVLAIGDLGKS